MIFESNEKWIRRNEWNDLMILSVAKSHNECSDLVRGSEESKWLALGGGVNLRTRETVSHEVSWAQRLRRIAFIWKAQWGLWVQRIRRTVRSVILILNEVKLRNDKKAKWWFWGNWKWRILRGVKSNLREPNMRFSKKRNHDFEGTENEWWQDA